MAGSIQRPRRGITQAILQINNYHPDNANVNIRARPEVQERNLSWVPFLQIDQPAIGHFRYFLRVVSIKKYTQGIDFLGYVILPHHITLRTKTKQRMIKKLKQKQALLRAGAITRKSFYQTLQSYLGLFEHCKNEWMKEWVESLFG